MNTFDWQIIKGTKKEKYKTTVHVCKHYHIRVHKGSSPFLILYADEIYKFILSNVPIYLILKNSHVIIFKM